MKAEEIKKRARERAEKLRAVEIKELGITVHCRPMTIALEQHLKLKTKDLVDDESRVVEIVMQHALDDEGKRIWVTDEDRDFVRTRMPSTSLIDIINAVTGRGFEAAKKN